MYTGLFLPAEAAGTGVHVNEDGGDPGQSRYPPPARV